MKITINEDVKEYMKKNHADSLIIDMYKSYTSPG